MPRLRLFTILCFDSQERREASRLVYRLDSCLLGLYSGQPVTVPPVPGLLRFTRQRHPPRQVTLPPPHPFSRPAAQRVIEVAALHLRLTVLYPRVEHQTVLAVVVVVVGPLVVHPYHPFRDAVRLLRQPAVFIVAVDIVRIFRDAVNYPFNPRSAQDASLDAFERFFKPDGILDTFYQQNLKLFIDNDLSLEDGDNNVIIREDIIAQLETAQKIRDIFFSKQNGLGTSFAVETVSLSGNKRRSVLNLDGQLVDYSQGRNYTAHLVWPNNMREGNESKLTLIGTSGNAPRSISFSGPWAQFRLFGAGQLTGVQDGNFTVRFSVDGGAMTYRVHTDTEDNPFSGGLFSQFGLSDTLY